MNGIGTVGMIFVGGPNVIYGPRSDWGDPTPTDVGFVAQATSSPNQFGVVGATSPQVFDFSVDYLHPADLVPEVTAADEVTLDLNKTRVLDSSGENPRLYGYLRDVLALDDNGRVAIDLHETEVIDKSSGMAAKLDSMLIVMAGSAAGTRRTSRFRRRDSRRRLARAAS